MEIERLGENKIRCALSEEEIREMGYNIDEIIGNTEVTQEFMRAVVELVEEQGNISLQNISPVVKAELLQDHSMAITFGGDSEMSFKNLVDTVGQLMNQLAPKNLLVVTYASALIWILVVISFTSAIKAEYISISIPTGDICGCSCFIRYACTSKLLFTSSSSKSCSLLITNLPHNIFSFAVHYISYVRLNYNSIYGRF
jgi:hypothetical protein